MRVVYSDPTPRWVPFATVAIIVVVVWGGAVWNSDFNDIGFANTSALWTAAILLIGAVLQGWLYWKSQVATLSTDGDKVEVATMRWVGWPRRIRFTRDEATGWRSISKHGDDKALSSVAFTVRGEELSLSFLSPKLVELEALSRLSPAFFERLKADFPMAGRPTPATA